MSEKTSTEFEIKVSGGRITCEQEIPDGKYKLVMEVETTAKDTPCYLRKGIFKKVPVSELRLDDEFLKYQPKTDAEREFMKLLKTAIKNGLRDFWRPVYDPSFDNNGRICYEHGKKPAVGKSYNWWAKNAKEFCPERGSRLGTKSEYVAFLAVLIKDLVGSGWKVSDAWRTVCNDSKELGHYRNSKDAKHNFETTGSRDICGWYDLANTYKILAEDEDAGGFWRAGGNYFIYSNLGPLVGLDYSNNHRWFDQLDSCGWLVFDRCPDC